MATSDAYAHGQDSETITGEQGIMREGGGNGHHHSERGPHPRTPWGRLLPGKKDGYPSRIPEGAVASGWQDQTGELVGIGRRPPVHLA